LHLYYHLALAGKLFRKIAHKTQKKLQATERLAAYRALTPAERYFFLLETLWMDYTRRGSFIIFSMHGFLERFSKLQRGSALSSKDDPFLLSSLSTMIPPAAVLSFSFFGWYKLERNEALYQYHGTKSFLPIAGLIQSELGIRLAKILMRHRPLVEWNLPHLRSEGIYPAMKEYRDKADTSFIELFREICEKDALCSCLPREIPKAVEGNFVFKVNLTPAIWRIIALSSSHTLADLHLAIQHAYQFDNDHLYAFYMDNKWRSEERIESPIAGEGITADDVKIGELDLAIHQSFLYHFDFGDDWRFGVQLLDFQSDAPLLKQPKILEKHGKAPEQYRTAEW
jgi:hypothetical protein